MSVIPRLVHRDCDLEQGAGCAALSMLHSARASLAQE